MARAGDETYHALCCYTLQLGDSAFIHQHGVDAYAAQTADEVTKPITLAFAVVGLYLHVVRGFSGREVQRVHMALARRNRKCAVLQLPTERGFVTVTHVMAVAGGPARDEAIEEWCRSVWRAFSGNEPVVAESVSGFDVL
jgi:hypothetical protein